MRRHRRRVRGRSRRQPVTLSERLLEPRCAERAGAPPRPPVRSAAERDGYASLSDTLVDLRATPTRTARELRRIRLTTCLGRRREKWIPTMTRRAGRPNRARHPDLAPRGQEWELESASRRRRGGHRPGCAPTTEGGDMSNVRRDTSTSRDAGVHRSPVATIRGHWRSSFGVNAWSATEEEADHGEHTRRAAKATRSCTSCSPATGRSRSTARRSTPRRGRSCTFPTPRSSERRSARRARPSSSSARSRERRSRRPRGSGRQRRSGSGRRRNGTRRSRCSTGIWRRPPTTRERTTASRALTVARAGRTWRADISGSHRAPGQLRRVRDEGRRPRLDPRSALSTPAPRAERS